jgi:hypothetical protein
MALRAVGSFGRSREAERHEGTEAMKRCRVGSFRRSLALRGNKILSTAQVLWK